MVLAFLIIIPFLITYLKVMGRFFYAAIAMVVAIIILIGSILMIKYTLSSEISYRDYDKVLSMVSSGYLDKELYEKVKADGKIDITEYRILRKNYSSNLNNESIKYEEKLREEAKLKIFGTNK